MSSKENVMKIEFLQNKRKISLPETYSDFIALLKKTFFITDERFDNMSLFYLDEDGDQYPLDQEEYTSKEARKATYWILSSIEDEDDEGNDILSAKEDLMKKKEIILSEAKKFKNDLYKQYTELVEAEIKKKNEKHQEEIKKIKEDYINNLKEFHNVLSEESKNFLDKVEEKLMNVYDEKINIINDQLKNELSKTLENLTKECQKELDKLNVQDIDIGIETMKNNIEKCKNAFIGKIQEGKIKNAPYEINNVFIEKRMGEIKNGLEFDLAIKNRNNKDLDGTYILNINKKNNDGENYQVKLNLSNLNLNIKRDEKIQFNPNIQENGEYFYFLTLSKNNEIVSNISEFKLRVVAVGSNMDLFE